MINIVTSTFKRVLVGGMFLCLTSEISMADVHLSINGSAKNNEAGLISYNAESLSLSFAFDVGPHLRLGITHGQETKTTKGYSLTSVVGTNSDGELTSRSDYVFQDQKQKETFNSLDLTVIIYYGTVVVPFLQGGMIVKNYLYVDNVSQASAEVKGSPRPYAGAGVNFKLSRSFSLRLAHTLSEGSKIKDTNDLGNVEKVWDYSTTLGVSYKI